ncbi:hypothetical protein V9T40_000928 [Parthenolecanium corni]|uniref:Uncharacterized protein n=1 Tax=Parthenolecanium corni TaxID=536013 RepID=A0AAN9TDY8_9HEMI
MSIIAIVLLVFYIINRLVKSIKPNSSHAVLITGCDSGVGYSLACHCAELGVSVFAACLNSDSFGAQHLLQLHHEQRNVHVIQMDVRETESVQNALTKIKRILSDDKNLVLKALVNNAGVMVFGEFAWQTEDLIQQQIDVNLVGAIRVTKAFLPMIVNNKGRVINITSHCSMQALPGLSVYAASKAGLLTWSDALRIEMKKFGIPVISLIPGSFFTATHIMANQKKYAEKMKYEMSPEEWERYQNYFLEYNSYLTSFNVPQVRRIDDKHLYAQFNEALLSTKPKSHYSNSPFRYILYHTLFKITPTPIRDELVIKFVNLPKWKT